MVAECLGALLILHGNIILPQALMLINNIEDKFSRWTVASSIRFACSQSHRILTSKLNELLFEFIQIFSVEVMISLLSMLSDSDLEVKKAALMMTNSFIHYQPEIISSLISAEVFPKYLNTVDFRQERTVDLGPFKHKVFFP
jgi:hypothetical protein